MARIRLKNWVITTSLSALAALGFGLSNSNSVQADTTKDASTTVVTQMAQSTTDTEQQVRSGDDTGVTQTAKANTDNTRQSVGNSSQLANADNTTSDTVNTVKTTSSDSIVNEDTVDSSAMVTDSTTTQTSNTNNTASANTNSSQQQIDIASDQDDVPAEYVSVKPQVQNTSYGMAVGQTLQLTAKIYPDNTTNTHVTWSVNNPSVAQVDQNGLVTMLNQGQFEVSATTDNGVTASYGSEVFAAITDALSYVKVNVPKTIAVGQTIQLTTENFPIDANNVQVEVVPANDKSRELLAATYPDNTLTGLKVGDAMVEVDVLQKGTSFQYTHFYQVTIVPAVESTDIGFINNAPQIVAVGSTKQLQIRLTPSDATSYPLHWTSDDELIAVVDQNGKVTGKSSGVAFITARTSNGLSTTLKVEVTVPQTATTFSFIPSSKVEIGQDTPLVVTANGDYQKITWYSLDTNILRVDSNGVITAFAPGTTTIYGTLVNLNGTTVRSSLTVTVDVYDSATLPVGTTSQTVANILNLDSLKTYMTQNKVVTHLLIPFNGIQFATHTIYYSVITGPNITINSDFGQITVSEQQLVSDAIAAWNEALGEAGSDVNFVLADTMHPAMLKFNQTAIDNTNSSLAAEFTDPGYTGNFEWSNQASIMLYTGNVSIMDENTIAEILEHEIGHALGLDHTQNAADLMSSETTYLQTALLSPTDVTSAVLNYLLPKGVNSTTVFGTSNFELPIARSIN